MPLVIIGNEYEYRANTELPSPHAASLLLRLSLAVAFVPVPSHSEAAVPSGRPRHEMMERGLVAHQQPHVC